MSAWQTGGGAEIAQHLHYNHLNGFDGNVPAAIIATFLFYFIFLNKWIYFFFNLFSFFLKPIFSLIPKHVFVNFYEHKNKNYLLSYNVEVAASV